MVDAVPCRDGGGVGWTAGQLASVSSSEQLATPGLLRCWQRGGASAVDGNADVCQWVQLQRADGRGSGCRQWVQAVGSESRGRACVERRRRRGRESRRVGQTESPGRDAARGTGATDGKRAVGGRAGSERCCVGAVRGARCEARGAKCELRQYGTAGGERDRRGARPLRMAGEGAAVGGCGDAGRERGRAWQE